MRFHIEFLSDKRALVTGCTFSADTQEEAERLAVEAVRNLLHRRWADETPEPPT